LGCSGVARPDMKQSASLMVKNGISNFSDQALRSSTRECIAMPFGIAPVHSRDVTAILDITPVHSTDVTGHEKCGVVSLPMMRCESISEVRPKAIELPVHAQRTQVLRSSPRCSRNADSDCNWFGQQYVVWANRPTSESAGPASVRSTSPSCPLISPSSSQPFQLSE
jgi:hypothetical protein